MSVKISLQTTATNKLNDLYNLQIEMASPIKTRSLLQLMESLPEDERIMVDVLRQIIIESLPKTCKEKISFNVPFFYGRKGICIIWPASIPRGGIKEGVLLGFWQGNKLNDEDHYLIRGSNKKIFYRIYKSFDDIDVESIVKLLTEAVRVDEL